MSQPGMVVQDIIPALGKKRQQDPEFKASLGYTANNHRVRFIKLCNRKEHKGGVFIRAGSQTNRIGAKRKRAMDKDCQPFSLRRMFSIAMSVFLCALGHEQERKFHELNIHIVKEANNDQNAVRGM